MPERESERGGDWTAGRGERNCIGVTSAGHWEREGKAQKERLTTETGATVEEGRSWAEGLEVSQALLQDRRGDGRGPSGGRSAQRFLAGEERVSNSTAAVPACAPLSPRASLPVL